MLYKKDIRNQFLMLRKALSQEELEKRVLAAHYLLFSRLMIHRYTTIHLFLPIKKNNEFDTWQIITTLRKDFQADIFTSKCIDNENLLHCKLENSTKLNLNQWGIEEPIDSSNGLSSEMFFNEKHEHDILILLPLLGFDKIGNRVGYGRGYYDRFLRYKTKKTKLVGLSLYEAIDRIEDTNEYDIKMDYCITPTKVWAW
jgi:5-formyltetrahydrofolate cyclo-ligase